MAGGALPFQAPQHHAGMKRIGLQTKLVRVFALQLLLISAATLVGIYATYRIISDVLIHEALSDEATHYWSLYEANPAQPLPNTANLRGYLERNGAGPVPPSLRGAPTGFHYLEYRGTESLVHVSEQDGARLYLVFLEERVAALVLYFGIVPLATVLLLIYAMSFVAYRLSQRAISPVVQLARQLETLDLNDPDELRRLQRDAHTPGADAEVATMAEAVGQFARRVDALVSRERTFTRDASHELRTPLAVLKGSLDLLELDTARPAAQLAALRRMRTTITHMESLIETLLLLARGNELEKPQSPVHVNEIVADQLAQLAALAERRGNALRLNDTGRLDVLAPNKVIAIVIGNLLRNAVNYTRDGEVTVTVDTTRVCIEDTGPGIRTEELQEVFEPFFRGTDARHDREASGHGLGLAIVKRLTHQFGWPLSITSQPGQGTRVTVDFVR
jgi:signal transduction histidine kinase